MDLDTYSDDELKAELQRRETAKQLPKPQATPFNAVDWTQVYAIALHHIEGLAGRHDECHNDDDCRSYVYEAVLQAMYGGAIWPWLRTIT